MDRVRVDPGMLPLETDLLRTNQFAMEGLAKLAEATLGRNPVSNGFTCLPTAPASLSVNVSPGEVYQLANLEQTSWSSLPADAHNVVKQGLSRDTTTLTLSPPTTVGFSVNVLIQVQYADFDDVPIVRPFYNAANPSQPFAGPGNNNQPTQTTRRGIVSIAPSPGVPNNAGSQSTPTPSPGWIGLFVVTLTYGQTQIFSNNIVPYSDAKVVLAKLPTIPASIQNKDWTFCFDASSVANQIVVTPVPGIPTPRQGTSLEIIVAQTNTDVATINVSGRGFVPLYRRDGTALIAGDVVKNTTIGVTDYVTHFRLSGLAQGEVPRIVPNAVLYVRTDGSDSNDGTANSPTGAFATILAAVNRAATSFVTGGTGTGLTIQLGIPGTYAAPAVGLRPNGNVTILGDLANQQNYIIQGGTNGTGSGAVLSVAGGGSLTVQGLTLQNVGSTQSALNMNGAINVIVRNVTFACVLTNSAFHATVGPGTTLTIQNGCLFSGNMAGLLYSVGGSIYIGSSVLTLVGTPTYTTATLVVTNAGQFVSAGGSFSGTATGTRYTVSVNGIIATNGAGASYIPGSTAGTTATGGQYV